ncbi:26 kDa periplasmic immunogenic protein [bacterium HR23]|nr:26 kDa periplasmic immunogenic protein [bacterium HR23]
MCRYRAALAVPLVFLAVIACTRSASQPTGSTSSPLQAGAPLVVQSSQQTGLWVTGEGKVTLTPTLALLSLGVEARADTVSKARDDAANAMGRILESLKANGVAQRDIQTRHFTVQPLYTYRERVLPGGERQGEQVLVGYQVSNQVSVKVRALERIGKVVDDAVAAGGDLVRVQGVAFSVDEPEQRQATAQARELAVKDALEKARQMAGSAGISLGKLLYLTESGSVAPVYREAVATAVPAAPGPPTPIVPGELTVTVTVQAVFAIP